MKKPVIVSRQSLQQMLNTADSTKLQHIVGRALVALFQRQTETEKAGNVTDRDNDVGFTGADARSGSLTAKSYIKNQKLEQWQVDKWIKVQRNGFARLTKYHKQLNEIAIVKANRKGCQLTLNV